MTTTTVVAMIVATTPSSSTSTTPTSSPARKPHFRSLRGIPSHTRAMSAEDTTTRRHSFRLTAAPLESLPVPPRLHQSPYLYSPESIFQRTSSIHKQPSEEDEQWLGDTVPLASTRREQALKEATSMAADDDDPRTPLASPPLFRHRSKALPPTTTPSVRSGSTHGRSRSDTHVVVTLHDMDVETPTSTPPVISPSIAHDVTNACFFS
ncbi:hypothetical protein BDV98DRAFT_556856 [Pterulicium gracile]|uniref:Uncharacterized protein n=1 Tax=Pterulicium gracile TaxID=1884261 RepID=A0A5C3QZX0_9AGAR|nr:hypothetical protein BDV98DRAFT_556856 [Pterula gracilis]